MNIFDKRCVAKIVQKCRKFGLPVRDEFDDVYEFVFKVPFLAVTHRKM